MERHFEFVEDFSAEGELLCLNFLRPLADQLSDGGDFMASDNGMVEQTRTLHKLDGTILEICFRAQKDMVEGGQIYVQYNLLTTHTRPFEEGFYVPGLSDNLLMMEQGQTASEFFTFDPDEPLNEEAEHDDSDVDVMMPGKESWVIREVHDYGIDDEDFLPRHDLRYEYHNGEGQVLAILDANDMFEKGNYFGSNPDETIDLQALNRSFSASFSEGDLRAIYDILDKFGLH